jgi:phage terminase large subunit
LIPSGVEGFYKLQLKEDLKDVLFIHTNYEDNAQNLNESTISNYERYKVTRPDYYYNMIKGLVSEGVRGRVFTNWLPISDEDFDALPYDSTFGLDFGFSNDPLSLNEIKEHNDTVWVKEWVYETGLTNPMLSARMDELGVPRDVLIIADSAEPKSIEELVQLGWNVEPSVKGADSVRAGINTMRSKQVYYTVTSTNIEAEQQNYVWALDKNKEPTNKPVDAWNHAMDSIRYVVTRVVEFIGFA